MTHMKPMADHEGTFNQAKATDRLCPKCKGPMTVRLWESSCGGYEDEKYECKDPKCGYYFWIDGPDS